jgi:hypothetical protein
MMKTEKMYLRLFHGRTSPDEELNGWGSDGPLFGPLQWAHLTYMSDFKILHKWNHNADNYSLHFDTTEDMVVYEGKYYGDWSVFMSSDTIEELESKYNNKVITKI